VGIQHYDSENEMVFVWRETLLKTKKQTNQKTVCNKVIIDKKIKSYRKHIKSMILILIYKILNEIQIK